MDEILMKTLIFNGSARKDGDTQNLIDELTAQLKGEYKIVNTHECQVRACTDCRYCWEHPRCAIRDEWDEISAYLEECDNVVLASPIYYCEITGPVLSVLSRLQVYWAARAFRKEMLLTKPKRGGMILVGGGNGSATSPLNTSAVLLRQMNAKEIFDPVCCFTTDVCRAVDDKEAMKELGELAAFLNREE